MQSHLARLQQQTEQQAELQALENEAIKVRARFKDFVQRVGLGYIGAHAASQYKLPYKEVVQRKPITHQNFGKGAGGTRYLDVEPQSTVFGTVDTIVHQKCRLDGKWADSSAQDSPRQAALRAEWQSILGDWRALAGSYRNAPGNHLEGRW